ncbi:MAG: hypothetical protein CMO55_05270 [Verrucomicrobiales bacterium]|nr:hypothetical protein [Verrucomicrobiales bacterium]
MQTQKAQRPLSPRQKHFLDRYHITGNMSQSWLEAGYNCTIGSASANAGRVLQREDAQEYLQSLQQYSRKHTGLTSEKLLNRLEQIIDDPNARDRDVIHAIREAGRMIGAYTPPKPEPEEKPVDTLHEFIKRVRAGEIQDHHFPPEYEETEPHYPQSIDSPSEVEARYLEESPLPEPKPEVHKPEPNFVSSATIAGQPRDPDWHPHYNPHYDPTIQKPRGVKVLTPRDK